MDESSTKVNLVETDLKNKQPGRTFTGPTCINFIFNDDDVCHEH